MRSIHFRTTQFIILKCRFLFLKCLFTSQMTYRGLHFVLALHQTHVFFRFMKLIRFANLQMRLDCIFTAKWFLTVFAMMPNLLMYLFIVLFCVSMRLKHEFTIRIWAFELSNAKVFLTYMLFDISWISYSINT